MARRETVGGEKNESVSVRERAFAFYLPPITDETVIAHG